MYSCKFNMQSLQSRFKDVSEFRRGAGRPDNNALHHLHARLITVIHDRA